VRNETPLSGKVVGITAERRAEDQAVLFRRLGAEVVLGPTIHTNALAEPARLRAVTEELIGAPPDYVIANTGMGMRSWIEAASEWELGTPLRDCLRQSRIVARGPKAAGAISSSKLEVWWRSPSEQLADVAAHLEEAGIAGKRVALQLHGDDQAAFVSVLESAGATVIRVPVYRWSIPEGPPADAALGLIERSCAGEIDAVTFTAGPQVRNLFVLAEGTGRAGQLLEAFTRRRPLAACIGPVCAGVAREEGIPSPIVPENWRLGSLVKAVSSVLAAT
jgi:uroporphyrinogen-III synthase